MNYELFSMINDETNILIGGSTGSGKSVFEDGMIYALATEYDPEDCEIYLIDPKMVELRKWCCLPHVRHYADNTEDALLLLELVRREMMQRYQRMQMAGVNRYHGSAIYVFIDELGDLTLEGGKDAVKKIQKLLQLCRAANIHIVCCSQKVDRTTVPAVLQANFTCRVGLKTWFTIESRQIIGVNGCENLPPHGKCIVYNAHGVDTYDVPMVSQEEIRGLLRKSYRTM